MFSNAISAVPVLPAASVALKKNVPLSVTGISPSYFVQVSLSVE